MRWKLPLTLITFVFAAANSNSVFADDDTPVFPHVPAGLSCSGKAENGLKTNGPVAITIRNISTKDEDLLLWTEKSADGHELPLEMTVGEVIPYQGNGFKVVGYVPDAWTEDHASPLYQLVVPPYCPSCPTTILVGDNKNYRYQAQLNCSGY